MKRELVGVPRERVTVRESSTDTAGSSALEGVLTGSRSGGAASEKSKDEPPESSDDETAADAQGATANVQVEQPSWVRNVKNAIPVEILAVWAAIESAPQVSEGALGSTVFTLDQFTLDVYGLLFGVMCVVTALYMWTDVESPTPAMAKRRGVPLQYLRHSQVFQIGLAVVGFVVWVYYLGGPFSKAYSGLYNPTYAIILLPLYVGLGPKLVPDLLRKFHSVEIPDERQRAPDEFAGGDQEAADASESVEPSES
jgi:hypothetical protein